MKRLFTYVTLFAAIILCMSSCKKDEEKERNEVANNLVGDWQGYIQEWKSYDSNKTSYIPNHERRWVCMRFNRSSDSSSGTGYQIEFKNEFMNNTPDADDMNEFNWRVNGDHLEITYKTWDAIYLEFKKSTINGSDFKGSFFTFSKVYKYEFDYKRKAFDDWDKYFKK